MLAMAAENALTLWFFLGAAIGVPFLLIGIVLRLCEGSWGKGRGDMGSTGFLAVGIFLCLPVIA
jgi:hypothetical protein